MRTWKHKPPALLILNLLMLVLLVLLAFLQYRWVGQISLADRERRRAALQETASRFCGDFDRELTRAFFHFSLDHHEVREVDFTRLRESIAPLYARRYLTWAASAPFRNIVSGLFIVDRDLGKDLRMARFNPDTSSFDSVEWPEGFQELREQIRHRFDRLPLGMNSGPITPIPPLVEAIPALVIPCFHRSFFRSQGLGTQRFKPPPEGDPLAALAIVQLDRTYLLQEFLPNIAKRHFFQGDDPEYDLVVLNRQPPHRIIYRSSASLSVESMRVVDAKINFFGLQPDELAGSVGGHVILSGRPVRLTSWRAAMPPHPDLQGTARAAARKGEIGYGDWEMLIKHRSGSLDAMVASTRRHNLAVSFGILLLLGGSVALLMVSVRRIQLVAKQQMDFVAGVSHELRTPLAVICSAGENLADGMITDPRQSSKYGALIRDEGRRLASMVEQVLNFAGIHSGRRLLDLQPLDPVQLVERALAACKPSISQGGFQIEKDFDASVPPILGDGMALGVSLENLLRNATQYSGNSRWIGIRVAAVREGRQEWVIITVSDKGMGIDPRDLPHIFTPFYRGSAVVKAQIRGTGLGLSLVKHIVEEQGGKIRVASNPGQGSAFTLLLPACRTVNPASALCEPEDVAMEQETRSISGGCLTTL